MKKLATILAFAGALAFVACGPSAEEKAKAEKMKTDSAHMADSVKSAQAAAAMKAKSDSTAKAAMEKAKMDSAKMADSAKAAPKKK